MRARTPLCTLLRSRQLSAYNGHSESAVIPSTYKQAQKDGFLGTVHEWMIWKLRRKPFLLRYGTARGEGYQGTFERWTLENPMRARITGKLPYISTLRRLDKPHEDDFILFLPYRSGEHITHSASRSVFLDDRNIGRAKIALAVKTTDKADKWLRPYFDPTSRCLHFQMRDGSDAPYKKGLTVMAIPGMRPLLHLAHAEGLLDKIPDGALSSLDFACTRNSGFSVHATVNSIGWVEAAIRVHGVTTPQPRFRFMPCVGKHRDVIDYFPYIAEDRQMRLWDISEDKDLTVRHGRGTRTSWSPDEVRRRVPEIFALAQSEGFWNGV